MSALPLTAFSGHISAIINAIPFLLPYNPSLSHPAPFLLSSLYLRMAACPFPQCPFSTSVEGEKEFSKIVFEMMFQFPCYALFPLAVLLIFHVYSSRNENKCP